MDSGPQRDILQRLTVSHLGWRIRATDQLHAGFQAIRGKDVSLLAVDIVQQGNEAGAVRIVLDRGYLGGKPILVTTEID